MKYLVIVLSLSMLVVSGCKVEPETINYGKDGCHFCKMTIVDNQHASELVTAKGKVYKYDAIECMINDQKKNNYGKIGLLLVSDYNHPGDLISAETAIYLISKNIPSPMGAFLSAFSNKLEAQKVQLEQGGEIYDWAAVQKEIK